MLVTHDTHDTHGSLNDIPGIGAGSTSARLDSDISGKHPNHNQAKTALLSECPASSNGHGAERPGGSVNRPERVAADTQEADSVLSDDCGRNGEGASAAKLRDDDDDLVHHKLTWR